MKIFYDFEFLENGYDITPISIGMVREDAAEYYAVFAETPMGLVYNHEWLRENVVPYLPTKKNPYGSNYPVLDLKHSDVKYSNYIAKEVGKFILEYPDPELWGYYSSFDHVCLSWLWGPMTKMPEGIPFYTNDLTQEMDRLGVSKKDLGFPADLTQEHNALADARWNWEVWEYLKRTYGSDFY